MRKPNIDPLLESQVNTRKKPAEQVTGTRERKNIGKAANTLFKGTPPPNAKSGKRERKRGERS
jgi:hypothetical protein